MPRDRVEGRGGGGLEDGDLGQQEAVVGQRLPICVGHRQARAGLQAVHAHFEGVVAGRGVGSDGEAVGVGYDLTRLPARRGIGAPLRDAVLLSQDLVLRPQEVGEDGIAMVDGAQGLPIEGER